MATENQPISILKQKLEEKQKIAVFNHIKPDGDAMGSGLGLVNFLRALGHEAKLITPTDYAGFLHWFPGDDEVINFETNREAAKDWLKESTLLFALDLNDPRRMGPIGYPFEASSAMKVLLDHHPEPKAFCDFQRWDPRKSSTAEIVFDMIVEMGEEEKIDKNVATCLYAGILSDTQSFKYSTKPDVLRKAARLMELGADNESIWERMLNQWSENRIRFFGHCAQNKMEYFPEFNAAMIHVNEDEIQKFSVETGDTEGLVNYPLSIKGVVFAALFVDRKDIRKMSFRSKGSFSVNAFAREHFGGGGHRNAAGAASEKSLDELTALFKSLLPRYKNDLIASNKED